MIPPTPVQIKRRKRSKKCCKAPGIAKPKRYNNCPSQMKEVSMGKCGSKSRRRRKVKGRDEDFIVKDVTKIGRDSANTAENRRKYFRPEEDDDEILVKTINKEYYGRKSRKKRRRKSRKNTKKAVKNNKKKKKKKTKKSSSKKRKRRKRTRK